MTCSVRMTRKFADAVVADLRRQHPWAFERVGFLYCETTRVGDHWTMYPTYYDPVADERYLHDDSVGAAIDGAAVRRAMQRALDTRLGTLHVHLHSALVTDFGKLDVDEQERLIPSLIAVN